MTSARDRKKSPEEMAAIMNQLKRDNEKRKRDNAIKSVKNGQYILFGLTVVVGLLAWLVWWQTHHIFITEAVGGFAVIFLILGLIYYKEPFVVPIIGLIFYSMIALVTMGILTIGIHVLVIIGLSGAIKYGKDYKAAIKYKETDQLDQGLFDENVK
jgi:hypothetical protein